MDGISPLCLGAVLSSNKMQKDTPHPGLHLDELKAGTRMLLCTLVFTATQFTTAQCSWVPLSAQMEKSQGAYTRREYYSAMKRNEMFIHAITWMRQKCYAR